MEERRTCIDPIYPSVTTFSISFEPLPEPDHLSAHLPQLSGRRSQLVLDPGSPLPNHSSKLQQVGIETLPEADHLSAHLPQLS